MTKQNNALRLAEQYDYGDPVAHSNMWKAAVCNELRRQHARIAELKARVQELGAMARENRSRRIVELEAQLDSIRAGGVSGPLIGKPQEMPDLSALTERGAKAWAGVDAQALRDGTYQQAAPQPAPAPLSDDAKDAARYRWLRDPATNAALVLDKQTGYVPADERFPGVGGYHTYEYRAGEELDAAIDAALAAQGGRDAG